MKIPASRTILASSLLFLCIVATAGAIGSWIYGSGVAGSGGEAATVVVRTSDGGLAVGGVSSGFGSTGFWLLKSGPIGLQRLYSWSFTAPLSVEDMIQTADNGFVIVGRSGSGCTTGWVLRLDATGSVVWLKTYATADPAIGGCGDAAAGVVENADGLLVIAGRIAGYFGIMRLFPDGGLLSARAYPAGSSQADSEATSLVQTSDGGFAAGGTWRDPVTMKNAYRILSTDSGGNTFWEETFGGADDSQLHSIGTHDSDLAVTGTSLEVGGMWTIRLDRSGNVVWQKTYTYLGGETGTSIVSTDDGGFALAGFEGSPHSVLMKLTGGGDIQWTKQFADGDTSKFERATTTFGGEFVAVGSDQAGSDVRFLAVWLDQYGRFFGCLNEEVSREFTETTTTIAPRLLAEDFVDESENTVVSDQSVTATDTSAPEYVVCDYGYGPLTINPSALFADLQASGTSNGNGVAEPGETFLVAPSWKNISGGLYGLAGIVPPVQDTNGLDLSSADLSASYGQMAAGATADCLDATGDCYSFHIPNGPRPSQHWDVFFDETLLGQYSEHFRNSWHWTIHVGHSFTDVSDSDALYPYIEALFHNGVSSGCGPGIFCADRPVTRGQMAPLLLKAKYAYGGSFVAPGCSSTVFLDEPCPGGPFVDWVNELAAEGITAGCGGGQYCPDNAVSRAAMAVFLLKGENGAAYVPPACTATVFSDVQCPGGPFVDWVNQLASEGITSGCGNGNYCPSQPVTRGQMAVFLLRTFRLLLN